MNKPAEQKSNRGRQAANPKVEVAKTFSSKIFDTHQFGYRRITIERPLRESYQFSDERIAELRFAPKPLNAVMKWVYSEYGEDWANHEEAIRAHIKKHFSDLKEAKIKELLKPGTWETQKSTMEKAQALQKIIGSEQHDDLNDFEAKLNLRSFIVLPCC